MMLSKLYDTSYDTSCVMPLSLMPTRWKRLKSVEKLKIPPM